MQRRRWRLSSYAYELFLIGDQQAEGSSKQRPVYTLKLRPAAVQWRLSVATEGTALVIPSFSMLSLVQSLELSRDGRGSDN